MFAEAVSSLYPSLTDQFFLAMLFRDTLMPIRDILAADGPLQPPRARFALRGSYTAAGRL